METATVNILIPILNPADPIEQIVEHAATLGKVFVIDASGKESTRDRAAAAGAVVMQRPFDDFSTLKNWAMGQLPAEGQWVLILNADERVTPALRKEILAATAQSTDADGMVVRQQLVFMGRVLRPLGLYRARELRLIRQGRGQFDGRRVQEQLMCQGKTIRLHHPLLVVRRESISAEIARMIRSAELRSDDWLRSQTGVATRPKTGLVPFRPLWAFLKSYLVLGGILSGRAGWHIAKLLASYEYMTCLLYRDKRSHQAADAPNDR